MNAQGQNTRYLANDMTELDYHARWSPDGQMASLHFESGAKLRYLRDGYAAADTVEDD